MECEANCERVQIRLERKEKAVCVPAETPGAWHAHTRGGLGQHEMPAKLRGRAFLQSGGKYKVHKIHIGIHATGVFGECIDNLERTGRTKALLHLAEKRNNEIFPSQWLSR